MNIRISMMWHFFSSEIENGTKSEISLSNNQTFYQLEVSISGSVVIEDAPEPDSQGFSFLPDS